MTQEDTESGQPKPQHPHSPEGGLQASALGNTLGRYGIILTNAVAALDITIMVPALACGGVLLWHRHPWGYVIASIAGVQGTLYLLVLTVNSMVAMLRGLAKAPGEMPVWGTLTVATAIATVLLLANIRGSDDAADAAS